MQVPQAKQALDRMKFEIAQEFGIQLSDYNGNLTSREAGIIGGNITKRLIQIAEESFNRR
jgi:hypothetical protein